MLARSGTLACLTLRLLWTTLPTGIALALFIAAGSIACLGFPSGVYVTSATFNGSASTSAALGSTIEIGVTATLVGSEGTDSWWCSTHYVLECAENGVRIEGCVAEPSPEGGCYCNWGCLAASWQWESQATARFSVTAPSVVGAYDVTLCALTSEQGCGGEACAAALKFADAITVTCGPGDTPAVELGAARALTCTSPSTTLSASVSGGKGPYTYAWTPGGATSQTLVVTSAGTYFVKVTGANGCSATDTVVVTDDRAAPSVEAGGPFEISCAAPTVVLEAIVSGGAAPYAYLWTPGNLTSQTISASAIGEYTVRVTGANGCSASDSVRITAPAGATNLVLNGGFEDGLAGWRLYPDAGPLSSPVFSASAFASPRETSIPCLDLGSGWLQSAAVGTSGPSMLLQDVTTTLTGGSTYRLTGWMHVDAAATSSPVMALLYATVDGTTPADGIGVDVRLPASAVVDEWTYCQSSPFVYNLPAGCTQAWLALMFAGANGTAWWDNVSLVAVVP